MRDSRTPDFKRKRTFSNPNSPNQLSGSSENHFLYQKVLELSKELNNQKMRSTNFQQEQVSRHIHPSQYSAQNTGQNVAFQPSRLQQPTGLYASHPSSTGQALPKDGMTGQALPTGGASLPMPVWGVNTMPSMPQWGQGFYQGTHQ